MRNAWFSKSLIMVLLSFSAVIAMAEERADDLTGVVTKDSYLYNDSWIWVVGAGFILTGIDSSTSSRHPKNRMIICHYKTKAPASAGDFCF
jgi:hypothetical protein